MNTEDQEYPEHKKLAEISDQSQAIGEFLNQLSDNGICLCVMDERGEWFPDNKPIQKRLAEYFRIDLQKIDREKRRMLEKLKEEK